MDAGAKVNHAGPQDGRDDTKAVNRVGYLSTALTFGTGSKLVKHLDRGHVRLRPHVCLLALRLGQVRMGDKAAADSVSTWAAAPALIVSLVEGMSPWILQTS